MIDTKYELGDTVKINEVNWTVEDIRRKFDRVWVYELTTTLKDGIRETLSIETGSLEKIVK